MSTKIYTSLYVKGNTIYYRGYDEFNKRVSKRIAYEPYLFINSKTGESEYSTIDGLPVDRVDFEDIKSMKEFIATYKDVSGFDVYGMDKPIYPFIHDYHQENIDYRKDRLNIVNLDIEVASEGHFASVENPDQEIITLTLEHKGTFYAFGLKDWDPDPVEDAGVVYIKCPNEEVMLTKFLDLWEQIDPDIVTGWFTDGFDIPYMIERMRLVFGEDFAKRLSPWGIILDGEEEDSKTGRVIQTRTIVGVENIDYMRLFKKFTYSAQESYALNHILGVLGLDLKVDYKGSLADLYRDNFPKFMRYNVRDVGAVGDIDAKTNLMDQALTIAFDARIPIPDVFGTVKLWDQIVHCELARRKKVIPPMKHRAKREQYAGAFVKEPRVGRHRWVGSLDVESLYPNLIVWGNLSPETYRGKLDDDLPIHKLLAGKLNDTDIPQYLLDKNYALAANLTVWDRHFLGIFPELVAKYLADRKAFKKQMLRAKADLQKETDPQRRKELEYEIARCNNMQMARKIQLNSLYGAVGNAFFRYYSVDFAEAITLSGQLAIQWSEHKINERLNHLFKTDGYEYVIYVDTDSNYISLEPLIDKIFKDKPEATIDEKINFMDKVIAQHIEPLVEEAFADLCKYMNSYKPAIVMKREALADSAIWTGKKMYALNVYDNEGVRYKEPDLKIMGLAAVRSSTPKFCRGRIKHCINLMLTGTQEELIKYVAETREQFNQLPFDEMASPSGCNGLKKYADPEIIFKSGTPMHVKGALIYNDLIKKFGLANKYPPIVDGDKIKTASLKMPNPSFHPVIACPLGVLPDELGLAEYIDKDALFEKSFISPVQGVADAIRWALEERGSLEDFFN